MSDYLIWIGILVVCLFSEAFTVSKVGMWFSAGALVTVAATFLGAPLWLQILLFVGVSGLCILLLGPKLRRLAGSDADICDALVGARGTVLQDIDNAAGTGKIRLGSGERIARSATGAVIPAGETVIVERIEGVKVFVIPGNKGSAAGGR